MTTAADPDAALELREAGQDFDIIISDIEMPGMNGFAFAEEVRKDARWSHAHGGPVLPHGPGGP